MNKISRSSWSIAALLALTPAAVLAQPSPEEELEELYGSEEFVRIATGVAQPVVKAPAVASILTAEDIRKLGATDIDEVLETGAVSAEHVLNVLGRLNASPPPDQVETALRLNEAPRADTDRYDRLRDAAGQEVDHA